MPRLPFVDASPPRAMLLVLALVVLASGALAAPGLGHVGKGDAERAAGDAFRAAGVEGGALLPLVPYETTALRACPASGRCAFGPFPPSEKASFGIMPVYSGSVTMSVRFPAGEMNVFSCDVPGRCEVVGTGSAVSGQWWVVGTAAPRSSGQYGVWVSYDG